MQHAGGMHTFRECAAEIRLLPFSRQALNQSRDVARGVPDAGSRMFADGVRGLTECRRGQEKSQQHCGCNDKSWHDSPSSWPRTVLSQRCMLILGRAYVFLHFGATTLCMPGIAG